MYYFEKNAFFYKQCYIHDYVYNKKIYDKKQSYTMPKMINDKEAFSLVNVVDGFNNGLKRNFDNMAMLKPQE